MMNTISTLYIFILAITILDFVWTQYLSFKSRKRMTPYIPEQLKGIYDKEKYAKQQAYQKENSRFSLLISGCSFIIILSILIFHGFGKLDSILRFFFDNPILLSLSFLGILALLNQILTTPLDYYHTFSIENKYGFNTTTKKTFWLDQFKGLLLLIIIGGIIVSTLVWFYEKYTTTAWLYAWGVMTVFTLFMTLFYSNILVPLFNKQTPLPEGELRSAIQKFSDKAGFQLANIYVMDASKRSTKANAYFTGLGRKKRIILYDTLINDLETEEIVAVLAHEIGHYKKKHTLQSLIISLLYTGIMLYLLSFFLESQSLAKALGSSQPSFHIGIIAFSIFFTPISLIIGLGMNLLSRKNEYQADTFAAHYGLSDALINGLKKLSVNSLSNLNPDPLNVFFYYSHPTLLQRINALKK